VLGVRYELSLQIWAVRSKPAATGNSHSYLTPNSNSLQKTYRGVRLKIPKRGRSVLAENRRINMLKNKGLVYWVVGFGDLLRGEKGEREKLMFSKPFHPTHPFWFCFFALHDYNALKPSNHSLYAANIFGETLGFRSSNTLRKSAINNARGLAALSTA
jgi:hypothetical protein